MAVKEIAVELPSFLERVLKMLRSVGVILRFSSFLKILPRKGAVPPAPELHLEPLPFDFRIDWYARIADVTTLQSEFPDPISRDATTGVVSLDKGAPHV